MKVIMSIAVLLTFQPKMAREKKVPRLLSACCRLWLSMRESWGQLKIYVLRQIKKLYSSVQIKINDSSCSLK